LLNQLVPFTDTYGGDFSNHLPSDVKDVNGVVIPNSGLHAPCANQLSPDLQAAWSATEQEFSTPDASGGCSPNTGVPVAQNPAFAPLASNAIPAALLDTNAQSLLTAGGNYGGIFPAPTTSDGHFIGGNNVPTMVREEIVRVDHTFNSKLSIFGHW